MALFKDKKTKKKTAKSDKISSATIITSCMKVTGDLDGTDTIHIDGHVIGNITVNNTVVIGTNGIVSGNIEAKHIIINGEHQGAIKCESLEVLQTGKVSHLIEARYLELDGTVDGDISAEISIKILEHANIHTTSLKSSYISVQGKVQGTIVASEMLEIGSKGSVEGQITVKNIKTEEGGRVIGTMSTYQEQEENPSTHTKQKEPTKQTENKISESEDDFFLEK